MSKYTIGVDFGQNSGRAILIDVDSGEQIAVSTYDYYYGIMNRNFIDGTPLPHNWSIANPQDYLDVLNNVIRGVLENISPGDVIGLGIDFSYCCMLPVTKDGTPLCFTNEFKNNPHAYVKLNNHISATAEAKHMLQVAQKRNETWLDCYNNSIGADWLFPKILETYNNAPEIYNAAGYFIEVTDWLVWQLTDIQVRNSFAAGYKALWNKEYGYPTKDYFKEINPEFENIVQDKLDAPIASIGTMAGGISRKGSELTGLKVGTAVSIGSVDIVSCMPTVKLTGENKMLAVMGSSSIFLTMSSLNNQVDGVIGPIPDGIIPGYSGYKANQAAVGETFSWLLNNYLPPEYHECAKREGRNLHSYLAQLMMKQKAGESGIVFLNWLRGNKSPLMNPNLTALFVGMTLNTKVEHMYRAVIESMAFDTRRIMDCFAQKGIEIDTFIGVGTIAERNPFIMQLYADILKTPVKVSGTQLAPVIGSAIFGACAAGSQVGGYDSLTTASAVMGNLKPTTYYPIIENVNIYDRLYNEYCNLCDIFSDNNNNIMNNLKSIQNEVIQ